MRNYLSTVSHTDTLLLGLPFRYDLSNSSVVNSKILLINEKLQKLTNTFPYTGFLETHNDSTLFTNHGLHRNRLGKKLTSTQIARCVLSIFRNEIHSSISLKWYEPAEEITDNHQPITSTRNSNLLKKPITRSNYFLW